MSAPACCSRGFCRSSRPRPTAKRPSPATTAPTRTAIGSSACSTSSSSSGASQPDTTRPPSHSLASWHSPPQSYGCRLMSTGPSKDHPGKPADGRLRWPPAQSLPLTRGRLGGGCPTEPLPPPRRLDCGNIDLLHAHHRLERPLGLFAAGSHGLAQRPRSDLPGDPPFVLAPAAHALLSAIAHNGIPIAVGLVLILGHHLHGKGFAVLEGRAAIEPDTGYPHHGEFDREHLPFLSGRIVARRPAHHADLCVGEHFGIELGRRLGVLLIPDADDVLGLVHVIFSSPPGTTSRRSALTTIQMPVIRQPSRRGRGFLLALQRLLGQGLPLDRSNHRERDENEGAGHHRKADLANAAGQADCAGHPH